MAAAPSKLSPSNHPMDGSSAAAAKEESAKAAPDSATKQPSPAAEEIVPPAAPPDDAVEPPTYQSVEASDFYLLAKGHLNDGKFDEAMSVIEEGIKGTQELLKRTTKLSDEEVTVHESMAPLHYLYGTVLLYSIEESDQEVTTAGSAVSAAVVEGGDAAKAAATAPQEGEAPAPEEEQQAGPSAADVDEDLQIAWENFEAARFIMEKMTMTEKLELDLAQLHLREGDLQRMNGRNEAAINDYQACLKLRKKSQFIDKYDRKLADVHYNLGLVYMEISSKDENAEEEEKPDAPKVDEKIKEAKREMARNKAAYHFLECSKCFCGQIASTCNADPASIVTIVPEDLDHAANDDASPKYKTTGEEDEEMELPKVASTKLATMRTRATELIQSSDLTAEQQEIVQGNCQLLEDIQETVDEAENSTKGVHEVTNMKDEVKAMAAADGEIGETKKGEEGTTTIGFGTATTSTGFAAASASATVSDAAAPAAAAAARPIMVVKKKKKRAALEPVQEPDSKKAKPETE